MAVYRPSQSVSREQHEGTALSTYSFWEFAKVVCSNVQVTQMGAFSKSVRDVKEMVVREGKPLEGQVSVNSLQSGCFLWIKGPNGSHRK